MTFTVTGTISGRPASVTCTRGKITGDADAIDAIEHLIATEVIVMAPVPSQFLAALTPTWIALPTILYVFDEGARWKGRVADPPWFKDPPGTIY